VLPFDNSEIHHWASRYEYSLEGGMVDEVAPRVRRLGHYPRSDFLTACRWKSPRIRGYCEDNDEAFVQDVTRTALSTFSERLRIEVLTLLRGVSWPMASVLLHFGHRDPYPILDYRSLWSLSTPVPSYYDFPFWWDFTQACRQLAWDAGVSMRVLDRALWQYSKEQQPPTKQLALVDVQV
jgi:hypothetical protein